MYKKIKIFTDGSCLGNPGPGGYCAMICYRHYKKIFSAGYHFTTNNRMELMATIISLYSLREYCNVTVSTDSQYVKHGITQWIYRWKKQGWKTTNNHVKNIDLWKCLDAISNQHNINWKWIKGHSGHPENEYCNKLARIAALRPTLNDIN